MPRLPGREPTRKTYAIGQVAVASMILQHEDRYWRHVCSIDGCDHRMGPDTTKPGWAGEWESCNPAYLPAFLVLDDSRYETPAGLACPCHVAEILAQ